GGPAERGRVARARAAARETRGSSRRCSGDAGAGGHVSWETRDTATTDVRDAAAPAFTGRVALVTGGARGLGAEIARTLARCGATVVIGDVREGLAEETASILREAGREVEAVRLDVGDAEDARATVLGVWERHGRVDVL